MHFYFVFTHCKKLIKVRFPKRKRNSIGRKEGTMGESALQAVNVAMRGGGYYSRANQSAKDVIDSATPLVLDAIRRMPDTDPAALFTLTDMGCADGGTSLDMVRQAITAVRDRWPQRSICIVYTDQPRNDYNSLFRMIHGLTPLPSYLDEVEDVHVLASAASFYRQILPAGTLDLGFSATAMHWLSRKPCDLTNHVHAVGASSAELAKVGQIFAKLGWLYPRDFGQHLAGDGLNFVILQPGQAAQVKRQTINRFPGYLWRG